MDLRVTKNNQIINLSLNKTSYKINIGYKDVFFQNVDEYYFTAQGRYTGKVILLEQTATVVDGENYIIEIRFDIEKDILNTFREEIWDLYVVRLMNGELKQSRIKSNYEPIQFLSVLVSEEQIFYPYTTRNGHLSFRKNTQQLFATLDSIHLTDRSLKFSGYFIFPIYYLTDSCKILNMKLVVTNTHGVEKTFPLTIQQREDIASKYGDYGNEQLKYCGIEGEFPFLDYILSGETTFYKLYLECIYTLNNEELTIRSNRIRLDHTKINRRTKIIDHNDKKYKIILRPTKKSKYLSLKIYPYDFVQEVRKSLRNKWVKIRRGRTLRKLYQLAFELVGKLPRSENTIVFESFQGKQFSDNPRAIYEYLQENHYPYKMYWSADRRHTHIFEEKGIKYVRRYSIKWLFVMGRAKYWVVNARLPLWLPKPKNTVYVQTWHGTPLKRLGVDIEQVHMPGTNTEKYRRNVTAEASRWDFLISPNAYSTEIFRRAFQYQGAIIESGYPRNDFLLRTNNEGKITKLKIKCQLPLDKKIILYAPTWRDNQFYRKGKYRFHLELDLDLLREKLGKDYIILLRLHYLVAENLDLSDYEGFVYNFSNHEDIRELYLIADILITDYSSVFFDYANLKRPMIFFVYDIDIYRDHLRGFYFDIEKHAPGPLVQTTKEIIQEVKRIEDVGFKPSENIEQFYNKFCYLEDGQATKRVVEAVFNR